MRFVRPYDGRVFRILLRLHSSADPRLVDVATVAELRAVRRRALADPDVISYTWRIVPVIHGVERARCDCGRAYAPSGGKPLSVRDCRCGLAHVWQHCACGLESADPPAHAGCGPIPWAPPGAGA